MAAYKGGDRVVVQGLAEFRREIRRLGDKEVTDELKRANKAAAQIVVDTARPSMVGAPGIARRLGATMKASLSQTRGQLSISSVRTRGGKFILPLGVEFGSGRNLDRLVLRNGEGRTIKGWNQFPDWRGNSAGAGYPIFPALRAEQARIMDTYGDDLERIYGRAFPD